MSACVRSTPGDSDALPYNQRLYPEYSTAGMPLHIFMILLLERC